MYAVKSKAVTQGMLAALAMVALSVPAYGAGGMLEGLAGVKAQGYVEGQYVYNFGADPDTNLNSLRVFDTKGNSFTANMAELALTKGTDAGLGFGLVLNYGQDTNVLNAGSTGADIFVQQAYVADRAFGDAVDLKLGKFATLAGAEVIEGPANYNISRSFLFGYAIPFTHTGLRAGINTGVKAVSLTLGLNNGWDNKNDDNPGKTLEAQVGLMPTEMLSLLVTSYYGMEDADGGGGNTLHDSRRLVDVVATVKPVDGLTVVFNYDRGSQANFPGIGNATWQGYAAYVNMALGDKHSVTLRGEVFDDHDGVKLLTNFVGTPVKQTLREVTLTFACKMKENLEWRAEFRHDGSNGSPFVDENGVVTGNQNTAALAAYYSF
jgi:hypothetical protein